MKNIFNLKTGLILSAVIFSLTVFSCRESNDDEVSDIPENYFSTTNYFVNKSDSTALRQATIGKWYDENNNLLLDIQSNGVNPDYPAIYPAPFEFYYIYRLNSSVQYYPITTASKTGEASRYGNNINLGGSFHLIVENNNGWLWVMNNKPQRIRVVKK